MYFHCHLRNPCPVDYLEASYGLTTTFSKNIGKFCLCGTQRNVNRSTRRSVSTRQHEFFTTPKILEFTFNLPWKPCLLVSISSATLMTYFDMPKPTYISWASWAKPLTFVKKKVLSSDPRSVSLSDRKYSFEGELSTTMKSNFIPVSTKLWAPCLLLLLWALSQNWFIVRTGCAPQHPVLTSFSVCSKLCSKVVTQRFWPEKSFLINPYLLACSTSITLPLRLSFMQSRSKLHWRKLLHKNDSVFLQKLLQRNELDFSPQFSMSEFKSDKEPH